MSAATLPPELHRIILCHVDSPSTLAACARVCQNWDLACARLLWQGSPNDKRWMTPSINVLADLAGHSRNTALRLSEHLALADSLDWHSNGEERVSHTFPETNEELEEQMRREAKQGREDLEGVCSFASSEAFRNASFRARFVTIILLSAVWCWPSEEHDDFALSFAKGCLNHYIIEINLDDSFEVDDLLPDIAKHCPRLESFCGSTWWPNVRAPGPLQHFLAEVPHLRQLTQPQFQQDERKDSDAMQSMAVQLLRHPNLESLDLPAVQPLKPEYIDLASKMGQYEVLPRLRWLCVTISSTPTGDNDIFSNKKLFFLHKLATHVPRLRALKCDLRDDFSGFGGLICYTVSRFHCLVDLELYLPAGTHLSADDALKMVEECPGLRSVRLNGSINKDTSTPERFSEDDIRLLAQKLPRLEEFILSVPIAIRESPFLWQFRKLLNESSAMDHLATFFLKDETAAALDELVPKLLEIEAYRVELVLESIIGQTVDRFCQALTQYLRSKRGELSKRGGFVKQTLDEEMERRTRRRR